MKKTKVLFVCMGNICRSPTAEAVFKKRLQDNDLLDEFIVDSAGTHAYHVGNPADSRSQETAQKRGYDLSTIRARQVTAEDFTEFDWILAADRENMNNLQAIAPKNSTAKLKLFLQYGSGERREIPDPYYGGAHGFDHVLDLIEDASDGFITELKKQD